MTMEVEITSKENIRPASPTPLHLRTYKLSVLDQLFPYTYIPMVFFYPNNQTTSLTDLIRNRSKQLKQSLSETLARFYPFAGKVKINDSHVDCNDDGVYYVETQIKNSLSNFLRHHNNQLIHQLLPYDPNSMDLISSTSYVMMVQVNIFNCGGIAISTCTSHKIGDGPTYIIFLKAWAATARGCCEDIYPSWIAPNLFPPNPSLITKESSKAMSPSMFKQGKRITRRFVFDATAIATLKAKAADMQNTISRDVAVTSLIWKCATAVSAAKNGSQRPSILSIAVNLRKKSSPPLSQYSVGNIVWGAVAKIMPNTESGLQTMVRKLKSAIDEIDSNFVEEIKGEEGWVKISECLKEVGELYSTAGADIFLVTSACNGGLYEADFGWGRPIWTCIGNGSADIPVLMNLIILLETRSGDGVEAWVTLSEEHMAIFEHHPELLSFASLDPCPLQSGDHVTYARL